MEVKVGDKVLFPQTLESSSSADGFVSFGRAGIYPGGGYSIDLLNTFLNNSRNLTEQVFEQLRSNNWIDSKTRVVLIEFVTFNGNNT